MCLFALVLAGCEAADETSGNVQSSYLERHREAFVIYESRGRILAELHNLLDQQGVTFGDPPANTIRTTRHRVAGATEELAVDLIPLPSGGTLVHVTSIMRDETGNVYNTHRNADLEWELAERVDPEHALAVIRTANERADKVPPRVHHN